MSEENAGTVLSAEEVYSARFPLTKLRDGYDRDQVDDFLDQVVQVLSYYEALAEDPTAEIDLNYITVYGIDVRQIDFEYTHLRDGYDQDEVDDYLDEIAETLEAYEQAYQIPVPEGSYDDGLGIYPDGSEVDYGQPAPAPAPGMISLSGGGAGAVSLDAAPVPLDAGTVPLDAAPVPLDGGTVPLDGGEAEDDVTEYYPSIDDEYDEYDEYEEDGQAPAPGMISLSATGAVPLDSAPVPLDGAPVPLDSAPVPLDGGTVPLDAAPAPLDPGTVPLEGSVDSVDLGEDLGEEIALDDTGEIDLSVDDNVDLGLAPEPPAAPAYQDFDGVVANTAVPLASPGHPAWQPLGGEEAATEGEVNWPVDGEAAGEGAWDDTTMLSPVGYPEDTQYAEGEYAPVEGQYTETAYPAEGQYAAVDGQYAEGEYAAEQYLTEDGQYAETAPYPEEGQYLTEDGQYVAAEGQYAEAGQYAEGEYAEGEYAEDAQYPADGQYSEDGQYAAAEGQYAEEEALDLAEDVITPVAPATPPPPVAPVPVTPVAGVRIPPLPTPGLGIPIDLGEAPVSDAEPQPLPAPEVSPLSIDDGEETAPAVEVPPLAADEPPTTLTPPRDIPANMPEAGVSPYTQAPTTPARPQMVGEDPKESSRFVPHFLAGYHSNLDTFTSAYGGAADNASNPPTSAINVGRVLSPRPSGETGVRKPNSNPAAASKRPISTSFLLTVTTSRPLGADDAVFVKLWDGREVPVVGASSDFSGVHLSVPPFEVE